MCDELLFEVEEQMAEAVVGAAGVAREECDERVKYHETGIDAFDSGEEVGKILWE